MNVMKPIEIKMSFGVVVACIALTACGNPYRLNYVSVVDRLPATPSFAPTSGAPRLVQAKNPREDVIRLMEEGYVPVGYVTFNSVKADEKSALSQAKDIGADVVLVSNQLTNVVNEAVPVSVYQGPESVRVDEHGGAWSGGGSVNYDRSQTVTYEGRYETQMVNRETAFYDQKALYFRRIQSPIFGAAVSALPEEARKSLGRNRGVVVRAVIKGSPAFRGDLMKGDILVGLDGQDIIEPREFYQRIETLAGRSVSLTGLRDGQPLNLSVQLAVHPPAAPKSK